MIKVPPARTVRRGREPTSPGEICPALLTIVPVVFLIGGIHVTPLLRNGPKHPHSSARGARGRAGESALPAVVASPYVGVMKRLVGRAVGLYMLFAIIGRFVEGMGAVECGCSSDCWCRRPVLSTFRWVFPFGHRSP
jgi:hypothetical protein